MQFWKFTANIKPLFVNRPTSFIEASELSIQVADRLEHCLTGTTVFKDEQFQTILEDLRECVGVTWLQETLNELYEWATKYQVWLGG